MDALATEIPAFAAAAKDNSFFVVVPVLGYPPLQAASFHPISGPRCPGYAPNY